MTTHGTPVGSEEGRVLAAREWQLVRLLATDKDAWGVQCLKVPEEGRVRLTRAGRWSDLRPVSYTHLTLPTKA